MGSFDDTDIVIEDLREEISILSAFVGRVRQIHESGDVGLNLEEALEMLDKALASMGVVNPPRQYALRPRCTVVPSGPDLWRCGHCDACHEAKVLP